MAGNGGNAAGDLPERVIPASRRPDGSLRKEVRIRAGYIPQDEVDRYQAKGTRPRGSGPLLPPGLDPEFAAERAKVKSKSAKKNEKRREKKAEARAGDGGDAPAITEQLGELCLSGSGRPDALPPGGGPVPPAMAAAAGGEPGGGAAPPPPAGDRSGRPAAQSGEDPEGGARLELEKRLRNLRKKVQGAQSLQAKASLTLAEKEKVGKLGAWQLEMSQLEAELKGMQ